MQVNNKDNNEKSQKLINTVGFVIRRLRLNQGKSMYSISAEVSMSKSTWREVEIGACKDIKLTTLWLISEGLDIPLNKLIDEVKKELGDNFSLSDLNN